MTIDALFDVDGDRFLPTDATPGPWGNELMHGGALGALCVHALEQVAADDIVAVRFSGDYVRPLLRQPLKIESQVVRSGKRLELVEGRVVAGDVEIARCSLVGIRPVEIELPDNAVQPSVPPPDQPDDFGRPDAEDGNPSFSFWGTGIEPRGPREFQRRLSWFRLLLPVVAGTTPSPMARAVAAADFGLGISSYGEWPPRLSFPNADLVVHCERPVAGEWVRVEAQSSWHDNGIGLCTMELSDTSGVVGRGAQSQVLSPVA